MSTANVSDGLPQKTANRHMVRDMVVVGAIVARIAIALLYIVTGLQKLPSGYPPIASSGSPVGEFFKAMIDIGFYWKFVGVAEILAAVLLLIPRLATLGALLLMPIAVNVWVITISLYPHFGNTLYLNTIVVALLIFLLAMDWPKLKFVLKKYPPASLEPNRKAL